MGVIYANTSDFQTGRYSAVTYDGLGVLAENIPSTGTNGPGYAYDSLSLPADNGKEVRGEITAGPSVVSGSGTIVSFSAYEDTSFDLEVTDDCTIEWTWSLYVDNTLDTSGLTGTITIGESSVTGTSAAVLDSVTHSASGEGLVAGSSAAVLDSLAHSASGEALNSGDSSVTLDSIVSSASGVAENSGSSSVTLSAVTHNASGFVGNGINGSSSVTLGSLSTEVQGVLTNSGGSSLSLGSLALSSVGEVYAFGNSAVTFDNFVSSASGAALNSGSSSSTLNALTQTASGNVGVSSVTGTSAVSLESFTHAAVGNSGVFVGFETAVQSAVYSALTSNTSLMNLISGVYDYVEDGETFPYVTIGEAIHSEWDTNTELGETVSLTVHSWSRYRSRAEVKQIQGAVFNALNRTNLTYAGFTFMNCSRTGSQSFRDSDGLTIHGVQTFEITLELN